ncbi:MAG: hypothetical protein QM771_10825 [Nitrospira sp.]
MNQCMKAGVAQRMTYAMIAIGLSALLLIRAQADDNPPAPAASVQEEPAQQSEAPLPADGEIQERGVPFKIPGGVSGGLSTHRLLYEAPTPSLTEIANAFQLRHKSLTTLMTVPPNLPVTKPVDISIGYSSPAGVQRISQSYVRSTGNRFLYNDPEGDGKPRRMTLSITLSEPNPGGQAFTFSLKIEADLDPLYDVRISPLQLSLISNCDATGNSEIWLYWQSPDRQILQQHYSARPGQALTLGRFEWGRSEISSSQQLLREKVVGFWDEDYVNLEYKFSTIIPGGPALVPGKTQKIKGNLKADNDSCRLYFEYTITYSLRFYPYL